ncbi:hypothetical protein B0J17DRAFT_681254 [Rhizoctonia solani]|nr:hypothetical protein B0J17DRAFT_681254 [Rhizoctonia solani]
MLIAPSPIALNRSTLADSLLVASLLAFQTVMEINSPNCCSGQYSAPATCPPFGVQHCSYFKHNYPSFIHMHMTILSGLLYGLVDQRQIVGDLLLQEHAYVLSLRHDLGLSYT